MKEIEQGDYYRKQLLCEDRVIAWSHRSRFQTALRLIENYAGGRLLDYGCGDGTFLAMASSRFQISVGSDINEEQLEDCRQRFRSAGSSVEFVTVAELRKSRFDRAFEAVVCMETLEHCLDQAVSEVLGDLSRACAPGGRIIISVPIETGLPFIIKYVWRRAAALRRLGHYVHYEKYRPLDALRMLLATPATALARPVYQRGAARWHSHYGFNWKALEKTIGEHLKIEKRLFSPLGFSGGLLSSQAWFICRPAS